jgi:hypothetical protein
MAGKPPFHVEPLEAHPADYDRLTYVVNLYLEHLGDQPFGVQYVGVRILEEKEEPYSRRIVVTGEWKPVDFGWVPTDKVGCVVVENLEGKHLAAYPSKEEQEDINKRVVEVSYCQDSERCDLLRPGLLSIHHPSVARNLYIRCRYGEAKVKVIVISR